MSTIKLSDLDKVTKLLLLLLFASSLHAQAVITDYATPVRTVTIGATRCTLWLFAAAAPGYVVEFACYQPNAAPLIEAFPTVPSMGQAFRFAAGDIAWQTKPNAADPTKIDYQISGQGPADAVAVVETGTL